MDYLTALGAVGIVTLATHSFTARASGQWNPCNALPHCVGAVGSGTPAIHCLSALGQWAVQSLECTASLRAGSVQCNSCNTLPSCLGAVGSGIPAMHCLTA